MGLLLGPAKTQCNHINMKKKKRKYIKMFIFDPCIYK